MSRNGRKKIKGRRCGRPKGSPNMKTIVQKIAWEKHKAPTGGGVQVVNTIELLLLTLRNKVMQGDVSASRLLDDIREKYAPQTEENRMLIVLFVKSPVQKN